VSENLFPSRTTRPAVSRNGLSSAALRSIASTPTTTIGGTGVSGDKILESVPEFISTESEHVIKNQNNSFIVLGRDRPSNRTSGYGGQGETQCGSIDMVCGRMSGDPRAVTQDGERVYANPDFTMDAARIYISQKTDVDQNFGLVTGRVGSPRTKSGIAIKADGVRIVGREGIKLVTRTDKRNSQGGQVQSIVGIDLIAGNDDSDLQPMVKGDSLLKAMDRLVSYVDNLSGIVDSFLMSQMEFNTYSMSHIHISPGFGAPTPPSPTMIAGGISTAARQMAQTKTSILALKANLATYKINFLNPAGSGYINSRHNHTN
tara:strand:- start:1530 stop:2480 length:951 start_codon:yes stop_codon:yes gene_type:complete